MELTTYNRFACIIHIAVKSKNISLCDYITDTNYRDICYSSVAESKRDINLCNYISNEKEVRECKARTTSFKAIDTLDMDLCLKVNVSEYQNLCFGYIVDYYGAYYCNNFDNKELKDKCLSVFFFNIASRLKNQSYCDQIPLQTYKRVCQIRMETPSDEWHKIDSDKDGLDDANELFVGTDPFDPDTDDDGIPDLYDLE